MSWRIFFSRKWWWVTLLVVVIAAVFVRLGIWQLDRLQQRRARNAELRAVLESPPAELTGAPLPPTVTDVEGREVTVTGTYDFQHQMLLKLQSWQGRAGVHLITPLKIAGSDTAVLVDRGWIPDAETENLGRFTVDGPVTVNGYVAQSERLRQLGRGSEREADSFQPELFRVDVESIATWLPYDLLSIYVQQAPADNSTLPLRAEPEIDLSDGPHLSYAIQWFIFSLIALGGYIYYVRRRETAHDAEKETTE